MTYILIRLCCLRSASRGFWWDSQCTFFKK